MALGRQHPDLVRRPLARRQPAGDAARPTTAPGRARWSSTAPAPSRASRPTSTCTAPGWCARPRRWASPPPLGAARDRGADPRGRRAGSAPTAPLYLRPMMWSREALAGADRRASPNRPRSPSASRTCRCATPGPLALTVSPFRRPPPDAALCEAKAACHYPNNARIVREARARGFQNALSLDQAGNVAETASTNVFLVRDGVVMTPAANGTFLNGITRPRVIALLRADGVEVGRGDADGRRLRRRRRDLPDRQRQQGDAGHPLRGRASSAPGRMAARARALYWDFAHQTRRAA